MGPTLFVFLAYVALTLLVGWATRGLARDSADYLQATHALPLPVVLGAYLAANCGALEVVGLSAMAAQYGARTWHFYWIGAVPAMVFLSLRMMQVYRGNGITSVPQYLELRYGAKLRLLNASVSAAMVLLLAGISLYALAAIVSSVAGLPFRWALLLCAAVVDCYVLLGGIRATVYNQVLQLLLLVAGLLPLALRCRHIPAVLLRGNPAGPMHAWAGMPWLDPHAPMDVFGVVFGLGAILGFSYWCTDFVLMQRAFTARTGFQARQVPLLAGFGKLLFAPLIILPGLAASAAMPFPQARYDLALPRMMHQLYGPWMLALGITALCASLMSAMASNLSAFAALCTGDFYPRLLLRRSSVDPGETASLRTGYAAILIAGAASVLLSFVNFLFSNLMEQIQLIFSVLGAPFWALFVCGMASRSASERGALAGFGCGSTAALALVLAVRLHVLRFGSTMAANFYAAMLGFTVTVVVTMAVSGTARARVPGAVAGRLRWSAGRSPRREQWLLWILSVVLLGCTVALNIVWR